jgi:peptidoglycan/xylan/chitin deacetylase (PgdA/CDA1 family)
MKTYPDNIPSWFSGRLPSFLWHKERDVPVVYLTFDDGPTPQVTTYVLDLLKEYDFKATFFCIGKCVVKHPALYKSIAAQQHAVGNHTHNHLNSWKVLRSRYVRNVDKAALHITSKLFRPPYGKLSPGKYKEILERGYKIVLWDVLSGDFDKQRSAQSILENVCLNTRNGSIIVFHDSEKCFSKLQEILPDYFTFLKKEGFTSKALD